MFLLPPNNFIDSYNYKVSESFNEQKENYKLISQVVNAKMKAYTLIYRTGGGHIYDTPRTEKKVADNSVLNNNPIWLDIVRSKDQNSGSLILKISKDIMKRNLILKINDKKCDISKRSEKENQFVWEISKFENGYLINFEDIKSIDIASYDRHRDSYALSFGFTIYNMSFTNKETSAKSLASSNQNIIFRQIQKISYKINNSSMDTTLLEDRNSQIYSFETKLHFNNFEKNKRLHEFAEICYANREIKSNTIVPLDYEDISHFELESIALKFNDTIKQLNFKKIKIDNDTEDPSKKYIQQYSIFLSDKYKYDNSTKSWIEDVEYGENGYQLPLTFYGNLGVLVKFKNYYNSETHSFNINSTFETPIFDKENGDIKLSIQKKLLNEKWRELEKNQNWKFYNLD